MNINNVNNNQESFNDFTADLINRYKLWLQTNLLKYLKNVKFILLRIPSIIVADLILLNSESITSSIASPTWFWSSSSSWSSSDNTITGDDRTTTTTTTTSDSQQYEHFYRFNFIFLYFISKFLILAPLFVCLLVFTLNKTYVLRIYKIIVLLSLPFVFKFGIDFVHDNRVYVFNETFELSKTGLVLFIYVMVGSLTILIYNDIYRNFIIDKHKIYNYYQLHRSRGNEVLTNFIDILSNQNHEYFVNNNNRPAAAAASNGRLNTDDVAASADDEDTLPESSEFFHWVNLNKRSLYIVFYSTCSFVLNELKYFKILTDEEEDAKKQLNIMSLGYLLLLTYDLASNFEQIILRLLIQLKLLGRLISQYGLNNFLSFNWFERLKVPYFLRLYFLLKFVLFTVNFLQYKSFYVNLNQILISQNFTENHSLYNTLVSFFRKFSGETNSQHGGGEDELQSHSYSNVFDSTLNQFLFMFNFNATNVASGLNSSSESIFSLIFIYVKFLILNLSNTIISIACTTSLLSYQFYLLGVFVTKITTSNETARQPAPRRDVGAGPPQQQQQPQVPVQETDLSNVGDVAAVLFFLLSIQSGLTSLSGLQRIEKFFKNYSLLFIAILHYFHTSIDSQLMSLSASSKPHNWNNKKLVRVLYVCLLLILIPVVLLVVLLKYFHVSTWLLAASAFNIELIVKMCVSLTLYSLFLIDSKRISSAIEKLSTNKKTDQASSTSGSEMFDNLDDYIYYVKAFGHIFEFVIAIFLFFNGAYILFFESYGAIRALMMCIHAYFHIWCQARKGWSVFIKRRTAIAKLKTLAKFNKNSYIKLLASNSNQRTLDRTDSDDENHDHHDRQLLLAKYESEYEEKKRDVCAICFCELCAHEALITNCKHIFHFSCLRKWLYLQDTCPMCHQVVYQPH